MCEQYKGPADKGPVRFEIKVDSTRSLVLIGDYWFCDDLGQPRKLWGRLNYDASYMADEIDRLNQWIHDCQSGMYINCVYCGFRYGPKDEVAPTMQQALYDHIATCPKHPLSKANAQIAQLKGVLRSLVLDVDEMGTALFGDDRWKRAEAGWWVDLVESYNRALEVLNVQEDA